jgi:hypothetical protein
MTDDKVWRGVTKSEKGDDEKKSSFPFRSLLFDRLGREGDGRGRLRMVFWVGRRREEEKKLMFKRERE